VHKRRVGTTERASDAVQIHPNRLRNESEVESKLIVQYLLPALGYTPDSWYQEVVLGSIRLDFLAFAAQVLPLTLSENSPLCLVIEAKSPRRRLGAHVRRLRHYLVSLRAPYGLITNGKELRVYQRRSEELCLVFQCAGADIPARIDELRALIGRDAIRRRLRPPAPQPHRELPPVQPTHTTQQPIQPPITAQPTNTPRRSQSAPVAVQGKQAPVEHVQVEHQPEHQLAQRKNEQMKSIAVYHNKGGVGKTTVAVNLAAALRKRGYRVLLIDLDSQANSTFATGLIKFQFEEEDDLRDRNVYHVLESGDFGFIQEIARRSHRFNSPEIDVVPAHISLIEGQYKLEAIKATQTRLIRKLQHAQDQYDYVVMDTPPSRDFYAQVAIIAADYLIIPSDLKPFANQGLSAVRDFITEIDEFRESMGGQPINMIGVLPSKISTNARFRARTFQRQKATVTDRYHFPVMNTVIFERVALSHSVDQTEIIGDLEIPDPRSIFDYASSNTGANQSAAEFEELADEVLAFMEKH